MQRILRWGVGAVAVVGLAGVFASCNQHPVAFTPFVGSVELKQVTSVDGSEKLDMLWVVDNSGSMCQEQATLRNNFDLFIEKLNETNLDFHIGVTTTDMNPDYVLEPVASPGRLQSTPQPVPGFDRSCHTAVDAMGNSIPDDYQPIQDAISSAVDCMTDPDNSFNSVSNADIACALYATPQGCTIARAGCGGGTACTPEDLFPDPSQYRSIPKVLRSADYKNGATLDVAALKADFACMSLVGTRGYGIEKGLSAAVEALKPELTGGTVDNPTDAAAPNHGLIRDNSRFAVVFVTDENDCSHDGTLAEDTPCGGDVCEFANKEGSDGGLVETKVLKEGLMANLVATKGASANFGAADVLVASIHGIFKRYEGDVPSDAECGAPEYTGVAPSCATALGRAFSGDRYERFLREFPDGQFFPVPNPNSPDGPLTGWMCTGDFRPALEAIGEFFGGASGGCITRDIYPCESDSECPAFPFTNTPGSCITRPNSEPVESYCDSAVQVEAVSAIGDLEALRNSGYCIEDSIGAPPRQTDGCVIDGSKFSFEGCSGGVSGIKLQWADDNEARNALLGSDIVLRYNSVTSN